MIVQMYKYSVWQLGILKFHQDIWLFGGRKGRVYILLYHLWALWKIGLSRSLHGIPPKVHLSFAVPQFGTVSQFNFSPCSVQAPFFPSRCYSQEHSLINHLHVNLPLCLSFLKPISDIQTPHPALIQPTSSHDLTQLSPCKNNKSTAADSAYF